MAWTVNKTGLQAFSDKIMAGINQIPFVLEDAIDKASEATVKELHDLSPVDTDADNVQIPGEEGHLQDSFYAEVGEGGVTIHADIKTEEPIKFLYVTEGTLDKAPIVPLRARAMWWPNAPHPMRAVAGQAPDPFQDPIVADIESRGEEFFSDGLNALKATLEG